ncbi:methylated-DNA--[protein]-cysteine S-methyltransferase [Caldicellulosiruptor morganii]|uniref:Methylated-DNA--protein-cysteine methyltransferase n=1 Tax=Caldicellulosiruptor morganii TaxID=1387555 RepID=A0ABY7BMY8_9FIRM|nr:methylated-DNA--[protein]-cysteine S-methyltransferase [Caldicellulosiruptor morganii]WAM34180.1 methylated-DNA--[protein]-cysteine S-methyltransferase [Caldicellulosiruptor morganii]
MIEKFYTGYYNSPLGLIKVVTDEAYVLRVDFVSQKDDREEENLLVCEAISQLDEYFKGKRKEFDLRLFFKGTEFQKRVWEELMKVGYGKVISYSELAGRIGRKDATRAVANAVGKNPIAIIVPCHRVIKADGKLGGYSAGAHKKIWLLEHEGAKLLQKP